MKLKARYDWNLKQWVWFATDKVEREAVVNFISQSKKEEQRRRIIEQIHERHKRDLLK